MPIRAARPYRGHVDAGPKGGADPDHQPYEGQVTAACDGVKLPGEVSNFHRGGQDPEACRLADPALRAEGAIRTRTGLAAHQLLRMACIPFHHFRIVRRQGLEPRTSSLRGCYSDH